MVEGDETEWKIDVGAGVGVGLEVGLGLGMGTASLPTRRSIAAK